MKISQKWVGWASRSYEQIKRSVLNRLTTSNPELTDHSESNPLIILIDIFSGIAEVLHIYIDNLGRENFIGTARKLSSLLKLAKLLDYRVKTRIPAYVDLVITLTNNSDIPTPYLGGNIYLPKNSIIKSTPGGIPYVTQEDVIIRPGYTRVMVVARQYEDVIGADFGLTDGTPLFHLQLPDDYAHNSLKLNIDGIGYKEYPTFAYIDRNTRGFIVDILEDGKAYAIFGDGTNGVIPGANLQIIGDYKVTLGVEGNLAPHSIDTFGLPPTLPINYKITITNPDYAYSGSDFEAIEEIRDLAPRHLATLHRAVTYKDYIDIALLAPGVGGAKVKYCCADDIRVYIVPKTRGIAGIGLLNDTRDFFEDKRIVGRCINVLPAGITRIWANILLRGKPGFTENQIRLQAIVALDENYGFIKQEINGTINLSDIIALLDELSSVESVVIDRLYVEPYARPVNSTTTPLSIVWGPNKSPILLEYRLIYRAAVNGASAFIEILKNNLFYSLTPINVAWMDSNIISFTVIETNLYSEGDEWVFRVYPTYPEVYPTYTLVISDNTIPMIDVDFNNLDLQGNPTIFSNITIQTTTTAESICKPQC